jgi:uncharacterized protein (TIGR02678 family)
VSRFAHEVSELELADYQRTVRLVLRHPLITARWPDERALLRVRRFSAPLRRDLAEAFGYRLELQGSTARLVRVKDLVDGTQPLRSRTDREFDRQRYAYLMLCLAALGRAGGQIALSELADTVATDANRIPGLGLDHDRGPDRRAFVDAVGWLEERGAVSVADGSSQSWVSDPRVGEALYDVARDVVLALYRPTRTVQSLGSVTALLDRQVAPSGNEQRRLSAQRARRAVLERPVVYFSDVDEPVANHLRGTALAEDMQRLTGLHLERRAEGVLLVDTTAGFSAERFPGTGSVAQAAILLAVDIADRAIDPDGRRVKRMDGPSLPQRSAALVADIDTGIPTASQVLLDGLDDDLPPDGEDAVGEGRLPFITDSFVREAVRRLLAAHATSFGARWHSDPDQLHAEAVALLERFGCVTVVPGGVLVLPLVGRYRNTVAQTRARRVETRLF